MLVLDEQCCDPLLGPIKSVKEHEVGDYAGGGGRKVDQEAKLLEDLAHIAEVIVSGIANDGCECHDCGVELHGDVGGRRHFRS